MTPEEIQGKTGAEPRCRITDCDRQVSPNVMFCGDCLELLPLRLREQLRHHHRAIELLRNLLDERIAEASHLVAGERQARARRAARGLAAGA